MSERPSMTPAALDAAILRWLNDFATHGVLTTDADLTIQGWNAWLETNSGRKAHDVIGRSLLAAFPDLCSRGLDAYYRRALEGEAHVVAQALHGYVLPLRPKSGAESFGSMPQRGVIAPLFEGARVIGTITLIEDVSERMMRESELRIQIQALDAARANAEAGIRAKDEFLATLSHELRTPLASVLGWARILRTERVDQETLVHSLEVIERNAGTQLRLINDMLDMSRILTGKLRLDPGVVDVGAIARAAVDVVGPAAAAKGVTLRTAIDPMLPPIVADGDRLQQIAWNLLSNAVKFTERGGAVELRVEHTGQAVTLVVSDNGIGIEPEFLPHVFERFRQSDSSSTRRHGGLGLGLALVRQLVELHGGRVNVESAGKGQGTTVAVSLPLGTGEARALTALPASAGWPAPPVLDGIHVLLVDDNDDARALLALALEKQGARVTAAVSSAEALGLLVPGKLPDVVLGDLAMPSEDGFTMVRRLRSLDASSGGAVPAIAITAYARPEDRTRALAAGYQLLLVKPVDPTVLAAGIADLCTRG